MKKSLLLCNVGLFSIMYSISMFYVGYQLGRTSELRYPSGLEWLFFLAVNLLFLLIAIKFSKEHEYCSVKNYSVMATATIIYAILLWVGKILFQKDSSTLHLITYPASIFISSMIASVFYWICAIKTKKEVKKYELY